MELHYPWKEPGDTCDSEDEGQHPSSAVLPNQKLRSVLDSAPFPQLQMWTLSGSPSVPLPGPLPCYTFPWCLLSPLPSFSLPGRPPPVAR